VSIFDDIKQSAEGRELSTRWYRGKITSLGGTDMTARQHIRVGEREGNTTARPNYGMMNLFAYRPKTAEKLSYYDIFPLSIPVKQHRDGFTGINFHYLSIPLRVKLLNTLVEAFGDSSNEKLDMTWRSISSYNKVRPIVRRYKARYVQSLFLKLSIEDMLIAVLLPVERFYTGEYRSKLSVNKNMVYRETRQKIV